MVEFMVWSGLRPGTPDELPILGPVAGIGGYVNATGGFRTGIVATPLTGRLLAQYIAGETPEVCLEPFSADRFHDSTDPQAVETQPLDSQNAG